MLLGLIVKQRALEIGFDLAGIAPIELDGDLAFSKAWVEKGYAGEMRYLENPKRGDPRSVLPSAKSVVCVGLIYNAPVPYSTEVRSQMTGVRSQRQEARRTTSGEAQKTPLNPDPCPQGRGSPDSIGTGEGSSRAWVSRYAWGRNYHEIMRAKLEELRRAIETLAPGADTRVFVDTGPVVERAFARFSGVGWMGKNTCLINTQKGSWFFLGVILTSLELEPDAPAPDRCGSCTRCLDACPTGALVEPYVMDASRCIAYFNIELKGSIPAEFRLAIGMNVFGCDICQDVCPWNRKNSGEWQVTSGEQETVSTKGSGRPGAATTTLREFQPLEILLTRGASPEPAATSSETLSGGDRVSNFDFRVSNPAFRFSLFNPPLDALAAMSEEDFRRAFAHSPIKRVKYRGWLRDLCVAMGNSGDARLIPKLTELAAHPDPIVREHAAWALARLRATPSNRV